MSEYTSKRLYRSRKGQMIAGVCAGLAEHFGVDVNLVRLAFAVFTIFFGVGVLIYLAAWVILPEEGEDTSIAQTWTNKGR
jgi:phage shock protein PspC (stress-responsive transcriptional regulator)